MHMPSTDDSSASFFKRLRRFTVRRANWLFALLFIGVLTFTQWPILKGAVYPLLGMDLPESRIAWRDDFEAALVEARASEQLVLLDFTASWCPPCRAMKYSTWPDERVEALAEAHFVPVLVDVDRPEHAALINTYNVQSVPTILIVNAQGHVVDRGGYMSARGMAGFLEQRLP